MGLFDMFKGKSADKELLSNGIDPEESFVVSFAPKEPLKYKDASKKCDVYFTYSGESKLRIEDTGKIGDLVSKEKIADYMENVVSDFISEISGQRSFENLNHSEVEQKIKEALAAKGISRILLQINDLELTPESEAFIESLNGKAYEDPNTLVPTDGYRYDFTSSVVMFQEASSGTTIPVVGHGKFTGKIVDKIKFGVEPTIGNLKAAVDKIYVNELMKYSGRSDIS